MPISCGKPANKDEIKLMEGFLYFFFCLIFFFFLLSLFSFPEDL